MWERFQLNDVVRLAISYTFMQANVANGFAVSLAFASPPGRMLDGKGQRHGPPSLHPEATVVYALSQCSCVLRKDSSPNSVRMRDERE